jgi:hypothetical protein
MDRFTQVRWCFLLLVLLCQIATAAVPIHHNLDVSIEPAQGYLEATDQISLPEPVTEITFSLHAGFKLRLDAPEARVVSTHRIESFAPVKQYKIKLKTAQDRLKLHYSGYIQKKKNRRPNMNGFDQMANTGIISNQGVFLNISSFWFPVINDQPVVFTLSTSLPDGWSSVSQGTLLSENRWYQPKPQDDIYLVAGKYHLFKRPNDIAEAQVYLRQPDQELAQLYLKTTEDYLQLFSKLLGPYPYSKFAMVENFWESGYGMPSFTLLGPRVLRLPFILHSSYPHEILHNWWGNSVFVDYSQGNWSEGVTSYLADHLIKEQRGQGSQYRRDTLQRYADFVTDNREYSLKDFRGYDGHASQAIGYGKTMMLLHMLRQHLGDKSFLAGLQLFYKQNLFKVASFEDMRLAFETVSKKNLSTDFIQWTSRTGAPALKIADVAATKENSSYTLSFRLMQTQEEDPYLLRVPVYIQTEGESEPVVKTITFFERETTRRISLQRRPLSLQVDPLFDLFRQLDPSEIPSSLGQLFAAENPLIVLPSNADRETREAYRKLANGWRKRNRKIKTVWDNRINQIPDDRAVWIFGQNNLLADQFIQSMEKLPASMQNQTLKITDKEFAVAENSFVLTSRKSTTAGWLHCHSLAAFAGLERKLPHYRKYSYLVFSGNNPDIKSKGQWPMNKSSLTVTLDKAAPAMQPKEHPPLSTLVK